MRTVRRLIFPAGLVLALVLSGLAVATVNDIVASMTPLRVLLCCAVAGALWVLATALRFVVRSLRD